MFPDELSSIPRGISDEIVCERFRVVAKKFLSGHALNRLTHSVDYDPFKDRWTLELLTELISEITGVTERGIKVSFEKKVEHKHFADWWSHFRYSVFPKCVLRWWPPRYRVDSEIVSDSRYVHIRLLEKYPMLPIIFPDCGESFTYISYTIAKDEILKSIQSRKDVPKIEVEIRDNG